MFTKRRAFQRPTIIKSMCWSCLEKTRSLIVLNAEFDHPATIACPPDDLNLFHFGVLVYSYCTQEDGSIAVTVVLLQNTFLGLMVKTS